MLSMLMTAPGLCRWTRTFFWKPSGYLLIIDRIAVAPDEDFTVGVNWRCGGKINHFANGHAQIGHDSDVQFHVQVSAELALTAETNFYPALGAPARTAPTTETMLHAIIDGSRETRDVSVATLLHATRGETDPLFRLITDQAGWIVTGPEESLRFCSGSEAGEFKITEETTTQLTILPEV